MLFSVIYSAEAITRENVIACSPIDDTTDKTWEEAENNDHEFENEDADENVYEETKLRERKWCAILTKEQFTAFVEKVGIFADPTPTMGSIGAPGFGISWTPAVSFRNGHAGENVSAVLSAYVTPIPSFTPKNGMRDHWWDRIVKAILSVYGD